MIYSGIFWIYYGKILNNCFMSNLKLPCKKKYCLGQYLSKLVSSPFIFVRSTCATNIQNSERLVRPSSKHSIFEATHETTFLRVSENGVPQTPWFLHVFPIKIARHWGWNLPVWHNPIRLLPSLASQSWAPSAAHCRRPAFPAESWMAGRDSVSHRYWTKHTSLQSTNCEMIVVSSTHKLYQTIQTCTVCNGSWIRWCQTLSNLEKNLLPWRLRPLGGGWPWLRVPLLSGRQCRCSGSRRPQTSRVDSSPKNAGDL